MPRFRLSLVLFATALAIAGCGGSHDDAAASLTCSQGAGVYLKALASAPNSVELTDGSAIGDCIVTDQSAGDLGEVGRSMVAAANKLNSEARTNPSGRAGFQLGFLVGAVEHAAENTSGVHVELVRRLQAAALFNPGGGANGRPLQRQFSAGRAAGEQSG